ncbi:NAD(P)-binding protein [Cystobasidium minutum MCA 4210]|uniref:NAD(P)-binding protein n=1 Tax=Cystobasidium minutum MCA 4210 TaxID=1397322 RepID=UPI0034CEA24E|eukprot:jgi/Rhomi1/197667/gm1.5881_g
MLYTVSALPLLRSARYAGWTSSITGASSGIGRDTAILFAKAGTNLVLTARRKDQLDKTRQLCLEANKDVRVEAIELDVSKPDQVKNLLDKIPEDLREVDLLVNNAGLVKGVEKVGDVADEDIDVIIDTNVKGLIGVTQVFVREFKKRDRGHIINLGKSQSIIAGREAYPGGSIYNASKFAVAGFTSALMKELVATQIRVSEVQPGMVETEFSIVRFRGDKAAADNVYKGLQPLTALDIAEDIFWIASRPPHINIAELFVMPVNQASPTLNYRKP